MLIAGVKYFYSTMRRYCVAILFFLPCNIFAGNYLITDCKPVVTITESKNNICLDSAVAFHAAITNDGTNGTYKWKKNNADVGTNSPDYTDAGLNEGDVIKCEYSCTSTCGTFVTVVSNSITMHVINDITPVITVSNDDPLICEGELTFFSTTAFYGNAIPSYQWKLNNVPIQNTGNSYITDTLTNGSKVECVLTISTPGCPGTKSTTSWMTIYVYPLIHPAIKITPSKTDICRGETVTFTATANGGAYPSFAWEINGRPTGDVTASLVSSSLKDGDVISCTVTIDQDSRCHTSLSAPSNKVTMHVKDYTDPSVTISAPLLDACAGTPLTFIATGKNTGDFTYYQWLVNEHGAGNSQILITNELKNQDKVYCVLSTSIPGCSFTKDASSEYKVVTIRDSPVITFSPPEVSVFPDEAALLSASVSGSISSFFWKPGNLLVTPQALTSYTQLLEDNTVFNLVVTDIHGCTASSYITVKLLHKMFMPSAFTPNKDGKNDVFRIPPGSSVVLQNFSVIDRWGHVIFSTPDISKGWDGTFKGMDLNSGSYIYVIKGTLDGKNIFEKGTVTLVR